MYLHALTGRGVHLATVNDYLARRDAEWMGPIYDMLGMTVGVIETPDVAAGPPQGLRLRRHLRHGQGVRLRLSSRPPAAAADHRRAWPTFWAACWASKARRAEEPVQRAAYFVLVDEADSILIDEARTPLIISALPTEEEKIAVECYRWSAKVAAEFEDEEHYEFDHEKQTVELTAEGRQLVRTLAQAAGDGFGGHVHHLRVHRAGDQGRPRLHARPAVCRARRRDRDRRRVHRPTLGRPQMARRHPPGASRPRRASK